MAPKVWRELDSSCAGAEMTLCCRHLAGVVGLRHAGPPPPPTGDIFMAHVRHICLPQGDRAQDDLVTFVVVRGWGARKKLRRLKCADVLKVGRLWMYFLHVTICSISMTEEKLRGR